MTSRKILRDVARKRVAKIHAAKDRPACMAIARAIAKGPPSVDPPRGRRAAPARRNPTRVSPKSDQTRLAELKAKLSDEEYMNGAILRIATVLSARLTLR
jgi:hypothetical protein